MTEQKFKEILIHAKSLNIISEELHLKLLPYFTFRHHFIHGYSFKLVPAELTALLKNAETIFDKFHEAIEKEFHLK